MVGNAVYISTRWYLIDKMKIWLQNDVLPQCVTTVYKGKENN